jgi:hypothetical protein
VAKKKKLEKKDDMSTHCPFPGINTMPTDNIYRAGGGEK